MIRTSIGGSQLHEIANLSNNNKKTFKRFLQDKRNTSMINNFIVPCEHGNLCEPIALKFTEFAMKTEIIDGLKSRFGPNNLSYTPDGIEKVNANKRLFEFKCPYSKAIDFDNLIYIDYLYQILAGMHILKDELKSEDPSVIFSNLKVNPIKIVQDTVNTEQEDRQELRNVLEGRFAEARHHALLVNNDGNRHCYIKNGEIQEQNYSAGLESGYQKKYFIGFYDLNPRTDNDDGSIMLSEGNRTVSVIDRGVDYKEALAVYFKKRKYSTKETEYEQVRYFDYPDFDEKSMNIEDKVNMVSSFMSDKLKLDNTYMTGFIVMSVDRCRIMELNQSEICNNIEKYTNNKTIIDFTNDNVNKTMFESVNLLNRVNFYNYIIGFLKEFTNSEDESLKNLSDAAFEEVFRLIDSTDFDFDDEKKGGAEGTEETGYTTMMNYVKNTQKNFTTTIRESKVYNQQLIANIRDLMNETEVDAKEITEAEAIIEVIETRQDIYKTGIDRVLSGEMNFVM